MTATVHPLGAKREPSLDPLSALIAADMNGVNAVILERMQSKVALIPELAGPSDRRRRQAHAPHAHARLRKHARLSRNAPPQARRGGRVYPHRDPASRRCRRRLGHAPRQAHRKPDLGQCSQRPGRRLPVQPGVRADGRGRQPKGAPDPQPRVGGDRRRRGRAIDRAAADRDRRRAVSHHHQRQDRRIVRRRLPGVAGRRRGGRGRRARARNIRPAFGYRLPAHRRRHRLCLGCGDHGQGRRRRFPRRQDDPAGDPGLCARKPDERDSGVRRSPAIV